MADRQPCSCQPSRVGTAHQGNSRHRFLAQTGTVAIRHAPCACRLVGLAVWTLSAWAMAEEAQMGETEHFWYRVQASGPYVDSQRENKAFGFTENTICVSEDCGRSWARSKPFPNAQNITFSCMLKNGTILFATQNKLYRTTETLAAIEEIQVKNPDGSPYLPHPAKNPQHPGWYFLSLTGVSSWDADGREMVVWGNYGNVRGGATPVNIYYSSDGGQTVKIAYAFGQNPHFRDNGSPGGGPTGTLLGNPNNPVLCRHVHCVAYNPDEKAFYACTGDANQPEGFECHWLRGTYDAAKDHWEWKVIVSASLNTRYKCGGINFVEGKTYWISDANGPEPHDRGVFCCNPADIPNPKVHTMLFNPRYECANMIMEDGVILAGHYATASPFTCGIIFSPDMGRTWVEYDLKQLGKRSPVRCSRKNSEGWFRVDLRSGWIDRAEVMFIKPKPAVEKGKK